MFVCRFILQFPVALMNHIDREYFQDHLLRFTILIQSTLLCRCRASHSTVMIDRNAPSICSFRSMCVCMVCRKIK